MCYEKDHFESSPHIAELKRLLMSIDRPGSTALPGKCLLHCPFAARGGTAADGLGCPRERLRADIYKLLVYEQGGFFLPHRDTEKTDGMVATLVVALPVRGSGGEIIVRHKGRETVIDMRDGEPSEIAWAAFYSDGAQAHGTG